MNKNDGVIFRTADFSDDRRHRHSLTRRWAGESPMMCAFVGLNPSIADSFVDDPTIRRCIGFAREWGYSGLVMLNIFDLVSTDPKGLRQADDPVSDLNEGAFYEMLPKCDLVICAWGTHGGYLGQGRSVLEWIEAAGHVPHVLRLTKHGHPSHPLYLPSYLKPQPWDWRQSYGT